MSANSKFWHDKAITIKHPACSLPHAGGIHPNAALPGNKIKIYCTKCFKAHIVEIQEKGNKEYAEKRRANPACKRADIEHIVSGYLLQVNFLTIAKYGQLKPTLSMGVFQAMVGSHLLFLPSQIIFKIAPSLILP